MFGLAYSEGGRFLLHLSTLRSIGQLFIEPTFAMIAADFVQRLCVLRNERQLAMKLEPVNSLLAALTLVRLATILPGVLGLPSVESTTLLVRVTGQTRYELASESASAYRTAECLFVLSYSLVLSAFVAVWLRSKMLWCLWLLKAGLLLCSGAWAEDLGLLANAILVYKYLNVQSLLYDVEDSREKLDRFFSYNFLFFDDD